MEPADVFDKALDEFDRRVHRVRNDQWSSPTPCSEWNVRDLVNHLTSEHLWAPWLLNGATLDEVGDRYDGDVLGSDPVAAWEGAAAASRAAFSRPGALDGDVNTSGGPSPARTYAWQMITDLTVHAWDLARGIGDTEPLDPELAHTVYEQVRPQADGWQGSGMFDPPVPVPDDAPAQDRLVALLGRMP